jgi:hypothetical protein
VIYEKPGGKIYRRDFIGSIIGLLAASRVPFVAARSPVDPAEILGPPESERTMTGDIMRMMCLDDDEIKRAVAGSVLAGWELPEHAIASPDIIDVYSRRLGDGIASLSLVFSPVEATSVFVTNGAAVLWRGSDKAVCNGSRFSGGNQCLIFGDTLKVTYTLCSRCDRQDIIRLRKTGLFKEIGGGDDHDDGQGGRPGA